MTDDFTRTWTIRFVGIDRYVKQGDSVNDRSGLMNFSHGVYAEPPMAGSPHRVHLYDVSVAREVDAATPVLMRLCQSGDSLPQIVIDLRVEKDGKEVYSMTCELINARITRVNTNGSPYGGDYRMYEDLGIAFEKIRTRVTDGEHHSGIEMTPPAP